jgi:hypothetical protein
MPSRTGRAGPPNRTFQVEEDSSSSQSLASSTPAKNDRRDVVPTSSFWRPVGGAPSRSAFTGMSDSPRPIRRATVLCPSPEKPRTLDIDVDNTPSY